MATTHSTKDTSTPTPTPTSTPTKKDDSGGTLIPLAADTFISADDLRDALLRETLLHLEHHRRRMDRLARSRVPRPPCEVLSEWETLRGEHDALVEQVRVAARDAAAHHAAEPSPLRFVAVVDPDDSATLTTLGPVAGLDALRAGRVVARVSDPVRTPVYAVGAILRDPSISRDLRCLCLRVDGRAFADLRARDLVSAESHDAAYLRDEVKAAAVHLDLGAPVAAFDGAPSSTSCLKKAKR